MKRHADLWRRWGIEETPKWWKDLLKYAVELDRHPGKLPFRRMNLTDRLTQVKITLDQMLNQPPTPYRIEAAPKADKKGRRLRRTAA